MMNKSKFVHPPNLNDCDRQAIVEYFTEAWLLEDSVMKSLVGDETFYLNPDPLRNPLIFYLGHSANFYINKLLRVGLLKHNLNLEYEKLFAVGVDPENSQQLSKAIAHVEWPEITEVWRYREKVYEIVGELIQKNHITLPINKNHPLWALFMGIEHQRIHVETSSVIIRQLPIQSVKRPENWQYAPTNASIPDNKMVKVLGGRLEIGKPEDSSTYGWDIEYGAKEVEVPCFLASKYLITNGDFLKFVQLGGYENQEYWDQASWDWKTESHIQHPKFWIFADGDYQYRAMFDQFELPLDWPVEVNHHEAIAYCRWCGNQTRLMSEAEWNLANLGNQNQDIEDYNLNLKFGSPSPVGLLDKAKNDSGLYDLRGNIWELLRDNLYPLSGFQSHPLYTGNSAPFFDTKHNMLLGGAWITNGTAALTHYRNWFRPHIYQHAGFRIVQDGVN
jgi:5-histidylcysteine sulfoxide synthase